MNDEDTNLGVHRLALGAQRFAVRWAFTRLYREFAWTYDAVAVIVSGGQWFQWTLAALPFVRGQVLELGCGTGHIQRALALRHEPAVGIDLSPQMLRLSQRKLARAGHRAQLARASAGAIPFPPVTFDTLLATFPSEYIVAPATIREVQRVLRPGGQIVILLAAQFHGSSFSRRIVDALYRITLQRPILAPPVPTLPDSIVGQCYRQAGFTVREFWHPVNAGGVDLHVIVAEATH